MGLLVTGKGERHKAYFRESQAWWCSTMISGTLEEQEVQKFEASLGN